MFSRIGRLLVMQPTHVFTMEIKYRSIHIRFHCDVDEVEQWKCAKERGQRKERID